MNELLSGLRALFVSGDQLRVRISRDLQVSPAELTVMDQLLAGPATPTALAATVSLTPGTLTCLVDRLEREGRVRRAAHPTDRRKVLVELTEAGRTTMNAIHCLYTELVSSALGLTSFSEVKGAVTVVNALAQDVAALDHEVLRTLVTTSDAKTSETRTGERHLLESR